MIDTNTVPAAAAEQTAAPAPENRGELGQGRRSPALDLIRIFACFSVMAVHFMMNSGYYSAPIEGGRMAAMLFYRALFTCCVPLFLLLSGYLLCNKKLEKRYYGRIWRILFTYLAASLFCVYGYRFLYNLLSGPMGREPVDFSPLGLWNLCRLILDFEAGRYAWYIEMYIGLFLLIPFLNVLYRHLPSKKAKQILILTGFVLSFLPSLVNAFNLTQPGWWANPTMRNQNGELYPLTHLIPDYWLSLYPFTYYYTGCYLREYGLKLKLWQNLLLLACSVGLFGGFVLWRSWGTTYVSGYWGGWNTPFNLSISVLIFCLFLNRSYRRTPDWVCRLLAFLSELTLGAYLVSGTFDNLIYPYLIEKQPVTFLRMDACFYVVPLVFVCSMFISWLIHLLYLPVQRGCRLLGKKS